MGLSERLRKDLETALKAAEGERVQTIRMLLANLHDREIEERGKSGAPRPLPDDVAEGVLRKELKKRKEASDLYRKGGRVDLAEKEEREAALIGAYLPPSASREEIEAVVWELKAAGVADLPALIRETKARFHGRAEGGAVAEIVRHVLGG